MIALESGGVESAGGSQLMIDVTSTNTSTFHIRVWRRWYDVHNKSTAIMPPLLHEVKRKGACKGDETIVACFSHDQHGLDVGFDTCTA